MSEQVRFFPSKHKWLFRIPVCVMCNYGGVDCRLMGGLHYCPICAAEYIAACNKSWAQRLRLQPPDIGADVPGGGAI